MDNDKAVIYACTEHVEVAIDDYVNGKETAPEICRISDKKCDYCSSEAEYEVK